MTTSTSALVSLTDQSTKARPPQTQKLPAKTAWAKLMDSPPGLKKDSLKKAARKPPPNQTSSPSPASKRSDLKSTPPRPGAPTVVGATPGKGRVVPQGEGKVYFQPDDITAVTAESSVSVASTRAAALKAANQAVQDNYLWSFSREGKFSGPDCNAGVTSFPLVWLKYATPTAITSAGLRTVPTKLPFTICANGLFRLSLTLHFLHLPSPGTLHLQLISTNLCWICSLPRPQPGLQA